jgi:hypothetical protein
MRPQAAQDNTSNEWCSAQVVTAPTSTPEQLDAAILTGLNELGGCWVPWTTLRRRVPGSRWQQCQRLVALHQRGRVYATKAAGRTYVSTPIA